MTIVDRLVAGAGRRRSLERDAFLFHQGDPVHSLFIVEKGLVELIRRQQDGTAIVLQRAASKTILAEASVHSEDYHCDAIVEAPTSVFIIPKAAFLKFLREDKAFFNLWTAHLAKEVQSARYRSEILTRKTVAERLDCWMNWPDNEMPLKGRWKSVALQIGVSPEALYRELAKRRSG